MKKEAKIITKIILIAIIAIAILLVLPKTVYGTATITFNRYGSFTIDDCPDNHYYNLAYQLLNSSTIDEFDTEHENNWTVGSEVSASGVDDYTKYNDGRYIMGGGQSDGTKFIPNGFCGNIEKGGDSGTGKIEYILDIYPNKVNLQWVGGSKEFTPNNSDMYALKEFANALYKTYNSTSVWGENSANSLRDGLGYFRVNANSINSIISKYTGKTLPMSGGSDDYKIDSEPTNNYHARIYFIKGNISQPRIIFKVDKVTEEKPEIALNFQKTDMNGNAIKTSGATLKIWDESNGNSSNPNHAIIEGLAQIDDYYGLTSESNGNFGEIKIIPTVNDGEVSIYIQETKAPNRYAIGNLSNPTKITISYDSSNGNITEITYDKNNNYFVKGNTINIIKIKNIPVGELTIEKTFNGEKRSELYDEVEFKIYSTMSPITVEGNETKNASALQWIEISPKNSDGTIKITDINRDTIIRVKETQTAPGYVKINKTMEYYVTFNNKTKTWDVKNKQGTSIAGNVTIDNKKSKTKELLIQKIDKESGQALPNIEFDLDISYVAMCMVYDTIYVDGPISKLGLGVGDGIEIYGTNYEIKSGNNGLYITYEGKNINIVEDGGEDKHDGITEVNGVKTDANGEILVTIIKPYEMGDANLDGIVNSSDARLIMRISLGLEEINSNVKKVLADINQDGYVTSVDKEIRDINGDGKVNTSDAMLLGQAANGEATLNEYQKILGDLDEDGKITIEDAESLLEMVIGLSEEDSYEKIASYNCETGEVQSEEDRRQFNKGDYTDAEYCLRYAIDLGKINYSLITVTAVEKDNKLYKTGTLTETFYYLEDKVIREENSTKEYIKNYVEALAKVTIPVDKNSQEYMDYKEKLDSLKNKVEDSVIATMVIENEPKEYNLTIKKQDSYGSSLGEGYQFNVTIDNNTFDVTTGSDGKVTISGLTQSLFSDIVISETKVPDGSTSGRIPDVTLSRTMDENGNIIITSSDSRVTANWNGETGTIEITVKDPIILNLQLLKQSPQGNALAGAKFDIKVIALTVEELSNEYPYYDPSITNHDVLLEGSYTTDSNGKIDLGELEITENNKGTGYFYIVMKETEAPAGYVLPNNTETTFAIGYITVNRIGEWRTTQEGVSIDGKEVSVTILNGRPLPSLNIAKYDTFANLIEDAEFNIKLTGVKKLEYNGNEYYSEGNIIEMNNIKTDTNGSIYFSSMEAQDSRSATSEFTIEITEIATPSGLKLANPITLVYSFDNVQGTVSLKSSSYSTDEVSINADSDNIYVKITDKNIIEKLTLTKTDSVTGAKLPNTKFNLDFGGKVTELKIHRDCVEGLSGSTDEEGYYTVKLSTSGITCKTNGNGQILLKDLVITEQNITCKVTETQVPTTDGTYYYKKINRDIYFDITYNGFGKDSGGITITRAPYADGDITVGSVTKKVSELAGTKSNNYNVEFSLENVPLIDLSGQVWLDGQQGEKDAVGPNGEKDSNEERLAGVNVYLNRNGVTGTLKSATTDSNGSYSFIGLERPNPNQQNNGYVITFEYNGITHQETDSYYSRTHSTNLEINSDASERQNERTNFNNTFKTIVKDESISSDENTKKPLAYNYNSENKESTLISSIDGTNGANGQKDFAIKAYTEEYKSTTQNIDCGLVEKIFDLALGTEVSSARLEINDKTTEYTYAQIMDGEMEDLTLDDILQGKSSDKNIIYNLYLYYSDYRYRISDYKTGDDAIQNTVNPEDNNSAGYEDLKELEAYVTYTAILKGQTSQTATVNEFVYYYDSAYTPNKIDGQTIGNGTTYTGDNYNFTIDTQSRKITFTSRDNTPKISSPDHRVTVELEFKVNKDNNGIVLKNNCKNIIEITKYSTDSGGLIDCDSAPDNGIENGEIIRYEDDTDEAAGINISLKDEERTITGTVWDDGKFKNADDADGADGVKSDTESGVDDVIVQLIEIKKINGQNYEYIWQETRSGSNKVTTTERNGYDQSEYTTDVSSGTGNYKFEGYIPGNYIIRFIYGDGRTYNITDNVKTYNGQDYKSTIDPNYQQEWFDASNYGENKSVARDNEARRLEVMAYSSTIDKDIGQSLEDKTEDALANTWMAAETSKINVQIDTSNTPINTSTVSYSNMNFGLALRPETKLVLEKHITALKITPTGTGVQPIVDAKIDIREITGEISAEEDKKGIQGITTGLTQIVSERGERGWWRVETDIEELTQGASLEVTYTYVIRDESDVDYLSTDLVSNYANDVDGYSDYLDNKAVEVKGLSKGNTHIYGGFLGEFYYTGRPGGNDTPVLSRVETFEETLNNDLAFDATYSGEDFEQINKNPDTNAIETVKKFVYDTGGKLVVDENGNPATEFQAVIQNTEPTEFLGNDITIDSSKTVLLKSTLAASGEGINLPSYIAQITKYTNAAGRRDTSSIPENLSYVHSADKEMTLDAYRYTIGRTIYYNETVPDGATDVVKLNEDDEFWAEEIIITKPTGEDKQASINLVIIAISSIAVLGVGIVLIKKFALKK